MAFLSGFVKSSLSLLGKDSYSFPYRIGEKVQWYDDRSIWTLHRGVRKEDDEEVSIFIFDGIKHRDKLQLARNAFKKLRTIRHPDVLLYKDGIENETTIMFVTEPVEPLSSQLNQNYDRPTEKHHDNLILWGLYKIANAIDFLNVKCNMVHGNVRVSSVFTNKAGEWKLGGFELISSMQDESPMILTFGGLVPDAKKYAPPEVQKSGWSVIKELPTTAVDSYNLGCLIYEAYHSQFHSIDQLLSQATKIPAAMRSIYKELLSPTANMRANAGSFLSAGTSHNGFFSNQFIRVNLFLENISIKEQGEKDDFFKKLDTTIDSFPPELAKYKLLPELVNAYEFGSGGSKALSLILKIGDDLSKAEYEGIIIGLITRMFASPDRSIRVSLLENMERYKEHIPNKAAAKKIFLNMATGFTDTVPLIKEQTIKALLHLVPKLDDGIINFEVLKYLAKLQMDEEPGIRTNATICLGKIAKHLNESTRKKVLVSAFTRSLRDGFHPARIAALMALTATSKYYNPEECSTRIIPSISPVLIDKEKSVRTEAFKALNCFVNRLEELVKAMPDTTLEVTPGGSSISNVATQSSMASMLTGWAVSSIQARMSPIGDIATPPTPSIQTPRSDSSFSSDPFAPATAETEKPTEDPWTEHTTQTETHQKEDDAWEPLVPKQTSEEFVTPVKPAQHSAASSFGNPTRTVKAMNLKDKKPALDLLTAAESPPKSSDTDSKAKASAITSPQKTAEDEQQKEKKAAELARRREERRQRMEELRKKKASSKGATKISS